MTPSNITLVQIPQVSGIGLSVLERLSLFFQKMFPRVGVLMLVLESTVEQITPKSCVGIQLGCDCKGHRTGFYHNITIQPFHHRVKVIGQNIQFRIDLS